jgi:formylglycine-generating enzyme required for sulfatase activity
MWPRSVLVPTAISVAALAVGCLLTLPFDDLTRDEALVDDDADAADTFAESSVVADTNIVADVEEDVSDVLDADGDTADGGTCVNKTMDGDETDTDCGGSCPRCSANRKCKVDSDCQSNNCQSLRCAVCPVGMVRVPVGVLSYCIDATEVTLGEYDAFVASATPGMVTFPAHCSWKATESSFAPNPRPSGGSTTPVRNVDWCDAWAYCDARGKRLCGAITTSSTNRPPAPFDKFDDPNVDQWRHACSYGLSPVWPYGSTADPVKCNTSDRITDGGTASVVAVRSLTGCVGAPAELTGLYDMSGNVAEWEDSCMGTSGKTDVCRVRGGSFREAASVAACGAPTTRNRSDRQDWVGFRCCRL